MPKSIPITLDKERLLKWTINAVADAVEASPEGVSRLLGGTMNISGLRAVLWGMLRIEEPRLTLEGTGQLLDDYLERDGNLADIILLVNKAIEGSGMYRKREDGPEGNDKPEAENPTSGNGSQTPAS